MMGLVLSRPSPRPSPEGRGSDDGLLCSLSLRERVGVRVTTSQDRSPC